MERLIKAFFYSLEGLAAAWRDEEAFRIEALVCLAAIPAAFFLAPFGTALALMLGSVLLVLIVELLNTAIEAAVDRMGSEIHPQAKKAKDAGSAAVLVAIINAFAIWSAILIL